MGHPMILAREKPKEGLQGGHSCTKGGICFWVAAFYHRRMTEDLEQEAKVLVGHSSKYTRNNPFLSTVRIDELLTAHASEKETRHIELTLDEGMTDTPGEPGGVVPDNRAEAVADEAAAV